eukprot:3313329-Amphidinium_carterae.2
MDHQVPDSRGTTFARSLIPAVHVVQLLFALKGMWPQEVWPLQGSTRSGRQNLSLDSATKACRLAAAKASSASLRGSLTAT